MKRPHLATQCAAVTTQWGAMTAPPQRWEPEACRLTCHGQAAPGGGDCPPPGALLEFTLCPQSRGNKGLSGRTRLQREPPLFVIGADKSSGKKNCEGEQTCRRVNWERMNHIILVVSCVQVYSGAASLNSLHNNLLLIIETNKPYLE